MKVNVLSRLGIITSDFITDKQEIENLLSKGGISNYKIANDGTVDIEGNIIINKDSPLLKNGKFVIKFGNVSGNFSINDKKSGNITSLEGCPEKVGGYFWCSFCYGLTSLEGAPKEVKGGFHCTYCRNMVSLKGIPQKIGEDIEFRDLSITSLKGSPKGVKGDFYCVSCENLTSLEGAPEKVGKNCSIVDCNITSLKGAPKEVRREFICTYCENLKSLEGAPQKARSFYFSTCSITSLKGLPDYVSGDFVLLDCSNLTSLDGAPQEVGRDFICGNCKNLTSLDGAPQEVGRKLKIYGSPKVPSPEDSSKKKGEELGVSDMYGKLLLLKEEDGYIAEFTKNPKMFEFYEAEKSPQDVITDIQDWFESDVEVNGNVENFKKFFKGFKKGNSKYANLLYKNLKDLYDSFK